MGLAFVYPGQGTQRVGMGAALARHSAAAGAVFADASRTLGYDVAELCARGPADRLTDTRFAQPALVVAGAAYHAALVDAGFAPHAVAGHSVGEFTAMWAAGALSFDDALLLVVARAELMSRVTEPGTMAAINGLDEAEVEAWCAAQSDPVVVGLYNAPQYLVVSGTIEAVARCTAWATDHGARRVAMLHTSHAFHSPLMDEVFEAWTAVAGAVRMQDPTIPVVVNHTGAVASDAAALRDAMVGQFANPVRWLRCMETLLDLGVDTIVETGDSKVLTGFARMVSRDATVLSMQDPRSIDRLRGLVPTATA